MKNSERSTTGTSYDRQGLQYLSGKENWFKFRTEYLHMMSMEGAVVLQRLINYAQYQNRKKEHFNGWFPYSIKLFTYHLCVKTRKIQTRMLNELIKLGYISTKRKIGSAGETPKRWIKIEVENIVPALTKVREELACAKREHGCTAKGTTHVPAKEQRMIPHGNLILDRDVLDKEDQKEGSAKTPQAEFSKPPLFLNGNGKHHNGKPSQAIPPLQKKLTPSIDNKYYEINRRFRAAAQKTGWSMNKQQEKTEANEFRKAAKEITEEKLIYLLELFERAAEEFKRDLGEGLQKGKKFPKLFYAACFREYRTIDWMEQWFTRNEYISREDQEKQRAKEEKKQFVNLKHPNPNNDYTAEEMKIPPSNDGAWLWEWLQEKKPRWIPKEELPAIIKKRKATHRGKGEDGRERYSFCWPSN